MVAIRNDLPLPLSDKHLADLKASGLTADQMRRVGYRSVEKEQAKQITGYALAGMLIPYSDPEGKPYTTSDGRPFTRLKPDYEGEPDPDRPKYLSPKGNGNRPYFSPLDDWERTIKSAKIPLWETEGEKKADKACAEGFACIGLPGVTSWQDKSSRPEEAEQTPAPLMEDPHDLAEAEAAFKLEESRQIPELDAINYKYRTVFQCYDSDLVHKMPVQGALKNRALYLQETLEARPQTVVLPTEPDGSKNGLDDFLVRHGREALQLLADFALPTLVENRKHQLVLNPQIREPNPHYKALMAWAVLKEHWSFRPGIGFYEWQGTHWKLYTESEFKAFLTKFMDEQGWKERGPGIRKTILDELESRLLQREDAWNPTHRLCFKNGTLNLATDVFVGTHERLDFMTACLPFGYNTLANCPTWLKFLNEATGERQELIELLQAWTKYLLTPKDKNRKVEIEKALILIGRKGTGKGTFLDVLIKLIGEENIGSASPDVFNDDKSMAQLLDKRVALDTDASGFLASPGNFNKVVSNEPVPIKRLYQNSITTRLGCSVVLAMNKFPDTPAGSEGLDRRLCVVPFDHAPAVIDPQLSQKLEAELSGIFAWAWSLSPNEMKRRILWSGSIPAVQQASIDRFEANNPVARFLQDTYPEGTPEGTPIQAKNLYAAYTAWCEDTGSKPKSQKWLSEGLDAMRCKKSRSSQNCVVYQIPPMKDFNAAAHLGLVHLVAVDEHTQPLELPGASGRFPDLSPDDATAHSDSLPELPDDSLRNFNVAEFVEDFDDDFDDDPIEKVSDPNLRHIRDAHPDGQTAIRHDHPESSGTSGSESGVPDVSPLPKDPDQRRGTPPLKRRDEKAAATSQWQEAQNLKPRDAIGLRSRVNKRFKTGWTGEVVEVVDAETVEVRWSFDKYSTRHSITELKVCSDG